MATRKANGDGSFHEVKDKNGKVTAYIYRKQFGYNANGKPNVVGRRAATKTEARRKMREYERQLALNPEFSPVNTTLHDYYLWWAQTTKKGAVKENTYATV